MPGTVSGARNSLEHQPLQIKSRAALTADARRREPAAGLLHQIGPSSDVAAGGGDGAAEVLDQRSSDQIRPNRRRFLLLHQLAVTVVDKDNAVGLAGMDAHTHSPAICSTVTDGRPL